MTIEALTKSTPVRLTIIQFCLLVGTIATGTSIVLGSNHEVKDRLHEQEVKMEAMQLTLSSIVNKQDIAERAAADRQAEWWRWRWSVTADLGSLSFKTSTPILTKQ